MTICHFFLQGRCRFGERCWNEHPAAPSGASRGGWSGSAQRYSNVIQPSNFSKATAWGGSRDPGKTTFGSFDAGASSSGSRNSGYSQNRFSTLSSNQADGQKDEEQKLIEGVVEDMETWESSGQWMFSVYSPMKEKPNVSGFTDISPEELRLEYSSCMINNALQSYLNSVQQLVSLWKSRLLELKNISAATKGALLSKLKNEGSQAVPAFGFQSQQTSSFGSAGFPVSSNSAQNFSFKLAPGFGAAPCSSSVFGSPGMPAAAASSSSSSTLTTSAPASFGFGQTAAVSAASFSFKSPEAFSFGSAGFPGFPAPSPSGAAGAPSSFGLSSSSPSVPPSGGRSISAAEYVFTPRDELTEEEIKEFVAKKFTLGKVPLKPPPEGLLSV